MFSQLLLRITVGAIFIYHALPKLRKPEIMAGALGSKIAGWLLGLVEFISGAALIVGFYTQPAALLLSVVMLGALYMKKVKWKVPFSAHDKTGWEFDLILLVANLVIFLINL